MAKTIGNPLSWGARATATAGVNLAEAKERISGRAVHIADPPIVQRLDLDDVRAALRAGYQDFLALRTDVVFLCLLYPLVGACMAWFVFNEQLIPLLAPLISGFALVGPVAGIGLYQMSRTREETGEASWSDAFAVINTPAIGAIALLAGVLAGLFIGWIVAADLVYSLTLGPEAPASIGAFVTSLFTTGGGWAMMIIGTVAGFVMAVGVLAVSLTSFPMLIHRNVGVTLAIVTSVRVAMANPVPVAAWGLIVAASVIFGSLTLFIGLVLALPILGHATWHLYRKAVVFPDGQ